MKQLKKIASKLHLILGLTSGIIVFIVSITGALYVFEQEWRDLTQAKYLYVDRQVAEETPLSRVTSIVTENYPKAKITNIRLQKIDNEDKAAAIIVQTKDKKAISLNPYSGEIIGVRNMKTDMMSVAVDIHTHLLLGDVGEQIIKWNVLIFFFMVITGLVLWLPPNWKMLKWVLTLKKAKTPVQLNYDLHRILGFYASFILLIIATTGIWWVFESVQHTIYSATNSPKTLLEKVKQPKAPPQYFTEKQPIFTVQNAFDAVNNNPEYTGWHQAFVQPPKDSATPMSVLLRYPYSWVRKQNRISFDQFTGQVLRADLYKNYSTGDKIRVSNYDWHTGRIGGIFTKILFFFAALFSASLPITGFLIWFNKWKMGRKRQNNMSFSSISKTKNPKSILVQFLRLRL